MSTAVRLHAVLLLIVAPHWAWCQRSDPDRLDLAPLREASDELAREVDYLQDEIATEMTGQAQNAFYKQADVVLGAILRFRQSLKEGVPREKVYMDFDGVDQGIHDLVKALKDLGPEQRWLHRSAARIRAADEQLHYALSASDTSNAKARQLLERQTSAFVIASRQLDKMAQYALGTVQGRGVFVDDLRKLADAAEAFEKKMTAGAKGEQLRIDFAPVNRAWERAIHGLKNLTPGENFHLQRLADRVERLHERLFRMLGIQGERPRLTIQA